MGVTTASIFLKTFGGKFFSFLIPRIKNSKFFRDIREKWVKDNYALKTTLLFQAAVADAKSSLDLPDELVIKLLEDPINRNELFHWVLDGSPENIELDKLNLEPYYEIFPQKQDMIRPFFELIALSIEDYKIKHWDPEFTELLFNLKELKNITVSGFNNVLEKQETAIKLAEDTNRFLKEVITPAEFNDLNELIKQGKLTAAREKAYERLKKPNLQKNEVLELHAVLANVYIESRQYKDSIKHLYTAITHCDNKPRKKRLEALINIFQRSLDDAEKLIQEAIELEGESEKNINLLINIYIEKGKYQQALSLIDNNMDNASLTLKAHILLSTRKYEKVISLANNELKVNPNQVDWLLLKAESTLLKMEKEIEDNSLVFPEKVYMEIMPALNNIEKQSSENIGILKRVKELKAALYFRNYKFSDSKILYEEIYYNDKDFTSFAFNNLLVSYLLNDEWEKVANLLEEKKEKQILEIKEIYILADVYIKAGHSNKALTLLQENKSNIVKNSIFPFNYYFTYIDALFSLLKIKEIHELISTLENEGSKTTYIEVLKGYFSSKKHEWENVITFLEPNIHLLEGSVLIDGKYLLSLAYLNRGKKEDFQKLKRVIETIPNWMMHEFLVRRYVEAQYNLEEYEDIITLYEKLPYESIFILDTITTIYFNLGWYELSKDNYLSLYQKTGNLDYQLRYANCQYRLGNTQDALDILSSAEVRVLKSGKVADFQLLCLAFMDSMQYRKAMEYAYKSYLEGYDDPQVWEFYFVHMSQLSQFVVNPNEEWLREYQNMFTEYERKFPGEKPLFKKIEIFKDGELSGELSDELINELKRPKDVQAILNTLLIEHKVPLNLL